MFFVISGFLITSHLLRELDRTRRVSLADVLGAASAADPARRADGAAGVRAGDASRSSPRRAGRSSSARSAPARLYVENWRLAANAVDYFASRDGPSPVQHYWSLSVEEQFYLVWPVVLGAVAGSRPAARRSSR